MSKDDAIRYSICRFILCGVLQLTKRIREMTSAQYYKVYLVIFSSTLGREQSEIVEAATLEHLNTWIANYKLSYCPDAGHTIEAINGAKMSDTANKA